MKRLLACLLFLQSSTSLAQTATEPEATTVQMGDDGYVEVPLEFDFPLFDQLFSTSWMYDNGIISFIQPGQQNAISPWQWSAQPIEQVNANYFIAALWADIAPTSLTKYTYSGDSSQMKYTWSNIAEYYSIGSSPRYSTFSTTIKADGTINTSFASVNLQASNISSGIVGNKSAGEYQSFYYGSYGSPNTMQDWTYIGTYVPPPPPPPPPPEPPPYVPPPAPAPSVPEEPSVVEEPVVQQTTLAVVEQPTVEATKQTASADPIAAVATVVEQQLSISPSVVASSDKKAGPSIDAQSIARNNQKALATLTDSVVSSSIQNSIEAGIVSAEASMALTSSTTSSGFSSSTQTSISSSESSSNTNSTLRTSIAGSSDLATVSQQGSTTSSDTSSYSQGTASSTENVATTSLDSNILQQPKSTIQESDTALAVTETSKSLDSVLELFRPAKGSFTSESMESNIETYAPEDTLTQFNPMQDVPASAIVDDINPTSVRGLASMTLAPRFIEEEESREEVKEPQLEDKGLTELAESGVRMDALQVVPVGYFNYLNLAYKDVAFYKDRKIYRKQKVVDNLRILRALNARDSKTFSSMIDSQYSLEDF